MVPLCMHDGEQLPLFYLAQAYTGNFSDKHAILVILNSSNKSKREGKKLGVVKFEDVKGSCAKATFALHSGNHKTI